MARRLTKTDLSIIPLTSGALTAAINGASAVTFSLNLRRTTLFQDSGGSLNRIFDMQNSIGQIRRWGIQWGSAQTIILSHRISNTSSPVTWPTLSTAPLDEWMHYAGAVDFTDKQIRLYVDGELDVQYQNLGLPSAFSGTSLADQLGSDANSAAAADADVANLAIYASRLSPDSIAALNDGYSPLLVEREHLVSYWPLDAVPPTLPRDLVLGESASSQDEAPTIDGPRIIRPAQLFYFKGEDVAPPPVAQGRNARMTPSAARGGSIPHAAGLPSAMQPSAARGASFAPAAGLDASMTASAQRGASNIQGQAFGFNAGIQVQAERGASYVSIIDGFDSGMTPSAARGASSEDARGKDGFMEPFALKGATTLETEAAGRRAGMEPRAELGASYLAIVDGFDCFMTPRAQRGVSFVEGVAEEMQLVLINPEDRLVPIATDPRLVPVASGNRRSVLT